MAKNLTSSTSFQVQASFGKDDQGNALITIPNVIFKGKKIGSIKIHLAPSVLKNLTSDWKPFTRTILRKSVNVSSQGQTINEKQYF